MAHRSLVAVSNQTGNATNRASLAKREPSTAKPAKWGEWKLRGTHAGMILAAIAKGGDVGRKA
ncbi:MAG: hypothetical protein V2A79_14890 [Planctomycetota bacterium]